MNTFRGTSSASAADRRGAPPVIDVEHLGKDFSTPGTDSPLVAIGDISLEVNLGEFVAVVGPSGCGKTTLLRILAGLTGPSRGVIRFDGAETASQHNDVGFVFQQANLYPWRTVVDNAAFGVELKIRNGSRTWKWGRERVREQARPFLELVGLQDFDGYYPHQLSGGMQQRVNLARALAIAPRVLLMDEPFGALDAQTREELQVELQRIALESNSTVLFITHDIREAVYLADRVLVLSQRPSTVISEILVPTPRPRAVDYLVSDEYNDLAREVWLGIHGRRDVEPGTGSKTPSTGESAETPEDGSAP